MPVGTAWKVTIPLTLDVSQNGPMPLDVCDLPACLAANDGPVGGGYTSISYAPYQVNSTDVTQSFPPAFIDAMTLVQGTGTPPPVVAPPSEPIVQPPMQVPVSSPVPTPLPFPVPGAVQAAGAGFTAAALVSGLVMAGWIRMAMRPVPLRIAMQVRSRGRRPSKA
jgi:hypothetical protein